VDGGDFKILREFSVLEKGADRWGVLENILWSLRFREKKSKRK
jgi:hypothetical protein